MEENFGRQPVNDVNCRTERVDPQRDRSWALNNIARPVYVMCLCFLLARAFCSGVYGHEIR